MLMNVITEITHVTRMQFAPIVLAPSRVHARQDFLGMDINAMVSNFTL